MIQSIFSLQVLTMHRAIHGTKTRTHTEKHPEPPLFSRLLILTVPTPYTHTHTLTQCTPREHTQSDHQMKV